MNYILADTNKKNFLPLTYTRPVSELRLGIFTIAEKWQKLLGSTPSYLTESYLSEQYSAKYEKVNVFINSKYLPTLSLRDQIETLAVGQKLIHGSDWVAVCVEGDELSVSSSMDGIPADTGTIIESWWDLFKYNGAEIENDIENLELLNLSFMNENIYVIGDENKLYLHPNAKVDGVSFNTTTGSIYVGEDAEIMEGSLIRGPFAIHGKSTIKMGAKIYGGTTIGPYCKVGGEVKNVVFQSHSNKSHEGYLGNAVLGSFVNLGAGTEASNLKNTYGSIKVWDYQAKENKDSGEQFLGCVIGDHSRTAIGTRLNTGTTIGVNANVVSNSISPKFIGNFYWGDNLSEKFNIDKAVSSYQRMCDLMGIEASNFRKELLHYLFKRRE